MNSKSGRASWIATRSIASGETPNEKELFKRTKTVRTLAGAAFSLMILTCSCSNPGGEGKDAMGVLTPLDIVREFQAASPSSPGTDISLRHIGRLMTCEGRIVGITAADGKEAQVQITVRSPSGESPESVAVFFSLNLDDYPGFGSLKAGDPIMITGEFLKVESPGIILRPRIVSYNRPRRDRDNLPR